MNYLQNLMQIEANRKLFDNMQTELHDHIMLADEWETFGIGDCFWWVREKISKLRGFKGRQRSILTEQLSQFFYTNLFEGF